MHEVGFQEGNARLEQTLVVQKMFNTCENTLSGSVDIYIWVHMATQIAENWAGLLKEDQ